MAKVRNETSKPGRKGKKKFGWKQKTALGFAVFVLAIVGLAFYPRYGTANYSLCKTFVELNELYPNSLEIINAYEEPPTLVFLSYKHIDPFGIEAVNELNCYFSQDQNGAIRLDRVDLNGKRKYPLEDQAVVDKFNQGIAAILAYKPNLKMPQAAATDIKDYR